MALWKACVLCAVGELCAIFWAVLTVRSRFRYSDILKAADTALFPLPRLLKPGFAALNLLPGKLPACIQGLSGKPGEERMTPFTAYCSAAWGIGCGLPILSLGAFLAAMTGKPGLLICAFALFALALWAPFYRFRSRSKAKKEEAERELPAVITKTVLLSDAGLSFTDTWHTVAASSDGPVYREMRRAEERMNNGMPAEEALQEFAERCGVRDAHQFTGILLRQKSKGGDDSAAAMRLLNRESWEQRKQRAKVKTAAASEAMLLPMLLIFLGILMMVVVPMLAGLQL